MIKKISIKDYFSPDIENIWDWIPSDVRSIYFRLDVYIGEKDSESSTLYSLIVSSPEALSDNMTKESFLWGRGYLIIKDYSFGKVESAIEELIAQHSKGKKTMEIFQSLNRELFWEYSDNKQ